MKKKAAAVVTIVSSDRKIILCDFRDGTYWQSPQEHTAQISAIATFGDNIITGSDDTTIKLWG